MEKLHINLSCHGIILELNKKELIDEKIKDYIEKKVEQKKAIRGKKLV
jgi:hypothetical protein